MAGNLGVVGRFSVLLAAVSWVWTYVGIFQTAHFKYIQFVTCQVRLSDAGFRKKGREEGGGGGGGSGSRGPLTQPHPSLRPGTGQCPQPQPRPARPGRLPGATLPSRSSSPAPSDPPVSSRGASSGALNLLVNELNQLFKFT